jgi:hypothetical protein
MLGFPNNARNGTMLLALVAAGKVDAHHQALLCQAVTNTTVTNVQYRIRRQRRFGVGNER